MDYFEIKTFADNQFKRFKYLEKLPKRYKFKLLKELRKLYKQI